MQTPAGFQTITIQNQPRKALELTAVTITFTANVQLSIGSKMYITYPKELGLIPSQQGCLLSNKDPMTECVFSNSTKAVNITNVNSDQVIEKGTVIQITLYGIVNSEFAAPTESFTIDVYTQDDYQILSQNIGLSITTDCDYPCLTCQAGKTSTCLTCDNTSPFPLYLKNKCLASCPSNYYSANYKCIACDPICATCDVGGSTCLSCFIGDYLSGNTCVSKCLPNVEVPVVNSTGRFCQQCEAPCATCTGEPDTCTSCLTIGSLQLYYENKCLNTCPVNKTVQQGSNCINCSSNCNTCSGLPSVCTSCNGAQLLDTSDSVCKDTCPTGISVQIGDKCVPCDSSCKTCASTDTDYCLTCQYGLNLYETGHQCLNTCPNGTVLLDQPLGPTCLDCAEGCLTCQNSTSYCTKCDRDHVFFKFSCISECPTGYHTISSERLICVKDREDCPYGYAYNDFGECALVVQICNEGYILNEALNKCIPVPGFYIPFFFLGLALVWTIYLSLQYKRGKIEDGYSLLTQVLSGLTFIQTFTYTLMLALAVALGYRMVTAIHLTTVVSMIIMNFAFGLFVDIKVKKNDQPFRFWIDHNQKQYRVLKYMNLFYSFKTTRLMFSKLWNKPYFNTSLSNTYMLLVRPLFITTVVNFILQAGPIILMDAYILMFIPWGYEIMIVSIDNLILALIIFILEIIEFAYFKRRAVEEKDLIPKEVDASLTNKQFLKKAITDFKVMGAADDEFDGDNQDGPSIYKMGVTVSEEDVRAFESMYLTKDGYKKSVLSRHPDGKAPQSLRKNKYIEEEEPALGLGRYSMPIQNDKKSNETKILERIVGKLNHEQRLNQIHTEPSSDQEALFLNIDPETKDLIGDTDDRHLLNQQSKQKLRVDNTRERFEQNLSFRSKHGKSYVQLANERVLSELNRAVYLDPLGIGERTGTEIREVAFNLESARTEKFNNYNFDENGESPLAAALKKSMHSDVDLAKYIDLEVRQIERDKRDYALYFRDFKAILKKQRKEKKIAKRRRCHSFEGDVIREWYDDLGPMSDFDPAQSNESLPLENDAKINTAEYLARLELFRQNLKPGHHYDNVYAQSSDPAAQPWRKKDLRPVTRRTQTYERDVGTGYDPFDGHVDTLGTDEDKNIEYDPDFALNLLGNLIENISELPSSKLSSSDEERNVRRRRRGKIVTKENFTIDDITGKFELDDRGNIVLDLNGQPLLDMEGRLVNKHGYLIDKRGNILSQDGDILFLFMELDDDEDIPQPYKFEKRRKHLLRQEKSQLFGLTVEGAAERVLFDVDAVMHNEDEQVEEEFQRLRQLSRPSSVDSLMDKPLLEGAASKEEVHEKKPLTAAERRAIQMAKAYGGEVPLEKAKGKKFRKSFKFKQNADLLDLEEESDAPLTDRLYPSLMHREDDRVRKIAKVAYRQGLGSKGVSADGQGFQAFFKKQLDEMQQNRIQAQQEFKRNHEYYAPAVGDPAPEIVETLQESPLKIDQNISPSRESSKSTNKAGSSLWGNQNVFAQVGPSSIVMGSNLNQSLPELEEEEEDAPPHHTNITEQEEIEILGGAEKLLQQMTHSTTSALTSFQNLNFQREQLSKMTAQREQTTHQFYPPQSAVSLIPPSGQSRVEAESFGRRPNLHQQENSQHSADGTSYQRDGHSQSKPAFRKFDFYLPSQKGGDNGKRSVGRRDQMNFSDVGQMQVTGNKIKDLEKLYLKKYPGHTTANAAQSKTTQHFNQYVTSGYQSKKQPPRVETARPSTSLLKVSGQVGRGAHQRMGLSQEGQGEDLFEGIAKVLGNIERLKGSEGPAGASDGETFVPRDDVSAFSAGTYSNLRRPKAVTQQDTTQVMSSVSTHYQARQPSNWH